MNVDIRRTSLILALIGLAALVVACAPRREAETQTAAAEPVAGEAPAVTVDASEYPNKPHHQAAELSCADCHATATPTEPAPIEACLECHGPLDDIVAATDHGEHKPNPHDSPHYGPENSCDLCHYEHEESENMCGDCHEWATPVP